MHDRQPRRCTAVSDSIARRLAGRRMALMGGTSNIDVIRGGGETDVLRDVQSKLDQQIDILGPECTAPLDASFCNMQILDEEAKKGGKWER